MEEASPRGSVSFCHSPNIFGIMKYGGSNWAGHLAEMGEDIYAFEILSQTIGKRPVE